MKNKYFKKETQQIVFVTGGSRGIGKEIVKKFLKKGSKVYFTYKSSSKKELLASNIYKNKSLIPIKCDMSSLNQIKKISKFLNKEKKLDILVNNVGGVIKRTPFLNSSDEIWKKTLDLNLMSSIRMTRVLSKLLLKSSNGVVVNFSSIASRTGGGGDSLHYATAKAAINTFTKGLARELKKIRVIGVAPSSIDTDFQKKHSSKKRLQKIINETPMGRIGTPEEIAEFVYFASSQKTSFLSGETIFITGGR
jgi:3-oxoacyl-[acyl-carrier protein] reductase